MYIRAGALASSVALVAGAASAGTGVGEETTPGARSPAATASVSPGAPLPDSLTGQKLSWKSCPAPTNLQGADAGAPGRLPDGTPWECATLKIPLDYADPGGDTINLALIRAKARPEDGQKRIGSLVFNFGGPGVSGVAELPQFANDYRDLHARYDLVSFDPRGVGASAPVRCLNDKDTDAANELDGNPDNDKELKADLAQYLAACEANSGKVIPHVSTTNAARDMDLLRHVLGDDKLHYFGTSYGTHLGGTYAHLFPGHVGRAVFDAVVDPTQDPVQQSLAQTRGFQLALDNYLKDCARQPDCPAGSSVEEGRKKIADLLKRLDARPLPTDDGRKVTHDLAELGISSALYSKDTWPDLTQALQEAEQGKTGNMLLMLADWLNGRDSHGHYDNSGPAQIAIDCADFQQRYTVDDVKAKLPEFRKASPVFGESGAWSLLECTDWPVKGEAKNPQVAAKGSAPILLVGNTGDPATPYAGTRRMAYELGKGVGIELTYKGQGHGAYGTNTCVTKAVNAYLLDGKVPKDGVVCM
ncbi:alpha/beta hydrolase [Streptomyces sp. S1D4-11]|nr:alpha/beta hydrolase [Streptomyces sp. S1D4-11]QIY93184.1 alpha/beta hydrolase [Streptomyces sp. S1D4-11]